MKRFYAVSHIILVLLALMLGTAPGVAQDGSPSAAQAGTEYYVAFMQNDDELGGAIAKFMGVMITSQVATVGTIEIPGEGSKPFSTRPGEYTAIPIRRAFEHTVSEDTIGNGTESIISGIRITSRAPIIVYVVNARHQSTSGYAAVPVSMWGTHYLPVALPNALGARTSELMIVAGYDDTYIRFTPSVTTVRQDRGVTRQIKLDRGRTYFVQALAGQAGIADLSGSEIVATRPIGVIAGHVRTTITANGSVPSDPQAYATHQATMMLPDSLWGSEYVAAPMRASGDRFRLMSASTGLIIITHYGPAGVGRDTLALDAGEVRDVSSIDGHALTGPTHWSSTAPISLLQMRTSGRYGDPAESPSVLALTSVDHMVSRTSFVAPEHLGAGPFSSHALTLVVDVPDHFASNPVDAFRQISIDGAPVGVAALSHLPIAIGSTGLYYASLNIPSGGHLITGHAGVTFQGYVTANNGSTHRDSYQWTLPWWGQPIDVDMRAPYVISVDSKERGVVRANVSDRTNGYFSGVGNIDVSAGNAGWIRTNYSEPFPDDDVEVTFRAVADPSGPLAVTIRDRDGNALDTVLHESVCFKTATATTREIEIRTEVGSIGSATLDLVANECGSEAHANAIVFGANPVALYLDAAFANGATTTTIPPNGRVPLTVTSRPTLAIGTYETTMRIAVDDSVLTVRIAVIVEARSAVADEQAAFSLRTYPNPVTASATIRATRAFGSDATISIVDYLGRTIRTFAAGAIAGRTSVVWDGRDETGTPVPNGSYLLRATDGTDQSLMTVSVVR